MKMPEDLSLHQQASLGDSAEMMLRSDSYTYVMKVMKERLYQRWLIASTVEDRETCWALATAHENMDRTLKEFAQRGDLAVNISNEENVEMINPTAEEVPA